MRTKIIKDEFCCRLEIKMKTKIIKDEFCRNEITSGTNANTVEAEVVIMGEISVILRSMLEMNPVPWLRTLSGTYFSSRMRSISEIKLSARLRS